MTYSNAFVCFMGIGTVFFGLICLIVLTKIMSFFCQVKQAPAPAAAPLPTSAAPEPDRQAMIAAVTAAVAEELGTDITGIRVLSFRKV